MINKYFSMMVIILLLSTLFSGYSQLFDWAIVEVTADAPPDNEGSVTYGTDWNVTGTEYRGNQTIILDGNLTVEAGGNLTLYNVTLIMNCSYDGEYNIEVQSGGEMWIVNGSNLTSSNPNFEYMFWVRKESNFTMKDSKLHECGWDWSNRGLFIEANNTILKNNKITNNYNAIQFYQSSNNIILGCNISYNFAYGLYLQESINNTVSDCRFFSNLGGGINSYYAHKNNFTNCNISNNRHGVILTCSNNNNVTECNITLNQGSGWDDGKGLYLTSESNNNTIKKCNILFNHGTGIYLDNSDHNNFIHCTVQNNGINYGCGISFYGSLNNTVINCNVSNNYYVGISLSSWSSFNQIINCSITNNYSTSYPYYASIELYYAKSNYFKNNSIIGNDYNLRIEGSLNDYIQYIDKSNTINGKPIYYFVNRQNETIEKDPGFIGLVNSMNITIKNFTTSKSYHGILLVNTSYSQIENVIINNSYYGIYFLFSSHNIINSSIIQKNIYGIEFNYYSRNNLILNSNISLNEWWGLSISQSANTNISYCNFTHNYGDGIWIQDFISFNNSIYKCNISDNQNRGLWVASSSTAINYCKINSNGYGGILFEGSLNNVVNCEIIGNSNYGISIYQGSSIVISNCNLIRNNHGISVVSNYYYYSDISISNCNISDNYRGIVTDHYEYVNIENCNILNNNYEGILFKYTNKCEIKNNTIKNNLYGLYVGVYSINNTIYHNNFISNAWQAYDESIDNQWYKPYPICGNYWDDFESEDFDHGPHQCSIGRDCIYDFPYDFNLNSEDIYPFKFPNGWQPPRETPILSSTTGTLNITGIYTLTWPNQPNTANYTLYEATNEFFLNPNIIYVGEYIFYEVTNKQNGTYYYRVRAQNLFGASEWSNTIKITVDWVPDIPFNLKVTQILTGNELELSWHKNYIDTVNYSIWSNRTGDWKILINISHPNETYIDTNLTDGIRYYYKLQAWDYIGACSGFSDVVSNISLDSTPPTTPKNLQATAVSIDTINLSWSPNTDIDLVGYHIYRSIEYDGNYQKLNTKVINDTFFQDSGRESNTTYYYKIRACDEVPNYSDYSEIVSNTTLPILDLTKPKILSYSPKGANVFPYIDVKVIFNKLMNKFSVENSFSISPQITGKYSWSNDNITFTFDPDERMINGQKYNVTISTKAKDLAGNPLDQALSWEFTIGDYTPPEIVSYSPNGTDVPIATTIEVVFNEGLAESMIPPSAIDLKHSNGTWVEGNITYSNRTLYFTPNQELDYGINYTAIVKGYLRDESGNELGEDFIWWFVTIEEPVPKESEDEEKKLDMTAIGLVILIFILIIAVISVMLKRKSFLGSKQFDKPIRPPSKLTKASGDDELQCTYCGTPVEFEDVICPACGEVLYGEDIEE